MSYHFEGVVPHRWSSPGLRRGLAGGFGRRDYLGGGKVIQLKCHRRLGIRVEGDTDSIFQLTVRRMLVWWGDHPTKSNARRTKWFVIDGIDKHPQHHFTNEEEGSLQARRASLGTSVRHTRTGTTAVYSSVLSSGFRLKENNDVFQGENPKGEKQDFAGKTEFGILINDPGGQSFREMRHRIRVELSKSSGTPPAAIKHTLEDEGRANKYPRISVAEASLPTVRERRMRRREAHGKVCPEQSVNSTSRSH
ncbi:hypothetical protein B0H16DRAFT_1468575 [Mycena metata]|uniref:Uncharacterized protein n=1 Tax=Mycena metata TaxID=1033252 RepID=A0AAD7MTV4_9AGAR|nr:hypothetical protein B0H16DRAFT_1468575 [Mycena metata]